jgi:hypothetical protein
MSDEQYVLGENVTRHATPSEPPRTTLLVLELEVPIDTLTRLEALSQTTGQSLEAIASAALSEYPPLAEASVPQAAPTPDESHPRKRVKAAPGR